MRLDRNVNVSGRGKYALLKLRKLDDSVDPADPFQEVAPTIMAAIKTLEDEGILDWGIADTEAEFFVIRLKDKYAQSGLAAYANAAARDGESDYAREIHELASRAGPDSPFCKKPD